MIAGIIISLRRRLSTAVAARVSISLRPPRQGRLRPWQSGLRWQDGLRGS